MDTLRGVKMFFNKTLGDENNRLFHITVWNDNDGIPGDTLMNQLYERPVFTQGLNKFHTYLFDRFVKLGVQSFWIGWTQTTNDNLNIGFDRNTNAQSKNYYNVDGSWVNSSFEGAIMIRPVLGKSLVPEQAQQKSVFAENLEVYPNPPIGTSEVFIGLPEAASDPAFRYTLTLKVVDLYGREVMSGPYVDRINIDRLSRGLYIISLYDGAHAKQYTSKLLIAK
ncbi:MAG: T9SS type A sorting domain-containing protein [Bacteroidales bacterium]